MIMQKIILVLVLVLKIASCSLLEIDVPTRNLDEVRDGRILAVPAKIHKDAIRHIVGRHRLAGSDGRVMVVPARVQKGAIQQLINSLQHSRQLTNQIERALSHVHGRQRLTGNRGRVMIVPARVDRLHVKPDFSQGLTLVTREPGSNSSEVRRDRARFFIANDVKLPFITPFIHSHPGRVLTPPPVVTSSHVHVNNLHSSVDTTNNLINVNNDFVPNSHPTTSPDPIFYFINNPTPISTQVSSSHSNTNNVDSLFNTNNRGVSTPHHSLSPNQLFYFVNRPTPPGNKPSQVTITPIGNDQIDITNLRNNIANILANNRIPNQQFDVSQPEANSEVQSPISNTLQQPEKNPIQGVDIQPIFTSTELNNSPLVNTFPNQQFGNFNIQPESQFGIQVSEENNLNAPQEPTTLGVDIQESLTSTGFNDSPQIIDPILQQLTPPSLDLPNPEAQVQQQECLFCNQLTTSSPSQSSAQPKGSQQKTETLQITSLRPKDLEALMIIVDGVLFRADPPEIGIHSTDPRLIPTLQMPFTILHQSTSQIKPTIISMLGRDVNMNFVL